MRIVRALAALVLGVPGGLAGQAPAPPVDAVRWLPSRYAADRFFVAPVTTGGDTLLFYTDTGGGANMVWAATARRLGLPTEALTLGEDSARLAAFPALQPSTSIPLPSSTPPFGERLLVMDEGTEGDGFLGRLWFADRVWLLDYPSGRMGLLPAGSGHGRGGKAVPLFFQTDSAGSRTTHFPRIRVEIDGDSLDLLFDTGATIHLTDAARAALGEGGPPERGGSFIALSTFERWRSRHPGWRVIEAADATLDMPIIEVPRVSIGGLEAGPVWFAARPDRNFHAYMSQWMDSPIEGALGGSALRHFRVLVDYPRAVAVFWPRE